MRHGGRARAVAVTATAAALMASVAGAQEAATPDYRSLFVKGGGQAAQATLGAFCHPNDASPQNCSAIPDYPLKTTGTLKVRPGTRVTLLFRADAGNVTWRAARIDGRGEEVLTAVGVARLASKRTKRRWEITVPKRLSRTTDLLGFDVQFPNAYSSFEVGLKLRR